MRDQQAKPLSCHRAMRAAGPRLFYWFDNERHGWANSAPHAKRRKDELE